MKTKLNIKPFDEFWINCTFNGLFSIMCTLDNSYADLAYMNCYSYFIEGEVLKGLKVKNDSEIYDSVMRSHVAHIPYKLKHLSDDELLTSIVRLLDKYHLMIGVDLYYWIPNSFCWKKYHWVHYSIVNEFDDETNSFIVLDESLAGYGVYRIPPERMLLAMRKCNLEKDGYILMLNEAVSKYELNISSIFNNAYRLQEEVKSFMGTDEIWNYSEYDVHEGNKFDLFSMYAFQISNRQKANTILTKRLYESGIIRHDDHNVICDSFADITRGWDQIKALFLKGNLTSPKTLNMYKIREIKDSLLKKESEVWKKLAASRLSEHDTIVSR